MAHQLDWHPSALDDIESIAAYIAEDSPGYAAAVVARFIQATRAIGEFPNIGRVVPELADNAIRERFVYNHRLIYEIQANRVLILAVLHGARLFPDEILSRID